CTDPSTDFFFNYQLARNASSFTPFAFANSPLFIPPSLLKPFNYMQSANHLRPLNLSLGPTPPTDLVSISTATSNAAPTLSNGSSHAGTCSVSQVMATKSSDATSLG